jgi:S-adenosylmethionine-diacylglycerol 3-amino-3-carboxypropyl transferase
MTTPPLATARTNSETTTRSEAAEHADFTSHIRYAQCWEDADILLAGLDIQPGDTCISIASAGDNSLSMLVHNPARVVAVDLNPAQLAALELRVSAYRTLTHPELLELIGSRPSVRRGQLYARCRSTLSAPAQHFWDQRAGAVANGIGSAGKFERYFRLFAQWILPLVHRKRTVNQLLQHRLPADRMAFYEETWDTPAWRTLFRVFFSETLLGWLGRDPSFFRYVKGSVADHLLGRVKHALAVLDPSSNPYVHWILRGTHGGVLPHALRAENFEAIRNNLDKLEWHCVPLEALTERGIVQSFDRANLSDIFEYMSEENAATLLTHLTDHSNRGARLAYWNMMVPRHGATLLPNTLRALPELSQQLFYADKAFFYRDFVVEEVCKDGDGDASVRAPLDSRA